MRKFQTKEEYRNWIDGQEWYQTIPLPSGFTTDGKFRTDKREEFFSRYDFKDKRVLDIGCNSGEYCFMAKRLGAGEVIGVDIDGNRIEQAKTIRDNEDMDITFLEKGIDRIGELGTFDIVLCVAVLTEIRDLIGAVDAVKNVTGEMALIEMDIARPVLYIPSLRHLLKGGLSPRVFAAARKSKKGWMLSPSMGLLKELFGKKFSLADKGPLVRYRMIEIRRRS